MSNSHEFEREQYKLSDIKKERSRSRSRSRSRNKHQSRSCSPKNESNVPQTNLETTIKNENNSNVKSEEHGTQQEQEPIQQIQYNVESVAIRKFCQPYSKDELVKLMSVTSDSNEEFYKILLNQFRHEPKWCKIFVHGLSWNTDENMLTRVFGQFGTITECVILRDRSGQSKGFGFVNFASAEEAMQAIAAGSQLIQGRTVRTDLAWRGRKQREGQPQQQQQQNQHQHLLQQQKQLQQLQENLYNNNGERNDYHKNNNNRAGLGKNVHQRKLFVASLSYQTLGESLWKVFSQFGPLEEAVVIKDKQSGRSKGYGFVTFKNINDAMGTLSNPELIIDGRRIRISLANDNATRAMKRGTNTTNNNNNNNNNSNNNNNNPFNDLQTSYQEQLQQQYLTQSQILQSQLLYGNQQQPFNYNQYTNNFIQRNNYSQSYYGTNNYQSQPYNRNNYNTQPYYATTNNNPLRTNQRNTPIIRSNGNTNTNPNFQTGNGQNQKKIWHCPMCTYKNSMLLPYCEVCQFDIRKFG